MRLLPGFPAVPDIEPRVPTDFVAVPAEEWDGLPGIYWGRSKDIELHRNGETDLSRSIINVRVSTNEFQTGPTSFTTSLEELDEGHRELGVKFIQKPEDHLLGPYPVRTAAMLMCGEPASDSIEFLD